MRTWGSLLVLVSWVCACTPAPKTPLVMGTLQWVGSEPLFLARELGLFSPNHIHLVEYTTSEQLGRAFRNGAIDVAVGTLEEVLNLERQGQHPRVVLVLDSRLPGEIVDVVVVREHFLREHPDQVDALLRGWFAALDHFRASPFESARLMAPRLGLDPRQFLDASAGVRHVSAKEQRALLAGDAPHLRERLQRLSTIMRQQHLLSTEPPIDQILDPSSLHRVAP